MELVDVLTANWRWPPMNQLCKLRGMVHVRKLIASFCGVAMGPEFAHIRKAARELGAGREMDTVCRQLTIAAGHCPTR